MAADVLRTAHYAVVDLGAAVPPADLARAVSGADSLVAVGLCVSVTGNERAVAASIKAARKAAPGVPVLLGGAAVDAAVVGRLGADGSATDAADLVAHLDALRQARR